MWPFRKEVKEQVGWAMFTMSMDFGSLYPLIMPSGVTFRPFPIGQWISDGYHFVFPKKEDVAFVTWARNQLQCIRRVSYGGNVKWKNEEIRDEERGITKMVRYCLAKQIYIHPQTPENRIEYGQVQEMLGC